MFPYKGATDRRAFIDTPGDAAPFGTIQNVRPRDPIGTRERGGQRPGIREATGSNGLAWGRIGEGPILFIKPITRPTRLEGYELGACSATHEKWEWRDGERLLGNVFVLRQGSTSPAMSRSVTIGVTANFTNAASQRIGDLAWIGRQTLYGCVNDVPGVTGASEPHFVWTAGYVAGQPVDGWGTPEWVVQQGSSIDPSPCECVASFPWTQFATDRWAFSSISDTRTPNAGYIVWNDVKNTVFDEVQPRAKEYIESGGNVIEGTNSANPGAHEVTGLKCKTFGNRHYLYFCWRASPMAESMVGRFDVTEIGTTGFDLTYGGSGAVQLDGLTFDFLASDPPGTAAINYPRGCTPSDVGVDDLGFLYVTRSSTGWGPLNGQPEHKPDYPGRIPVTIAKIDPSGTGFVWEALTAEDTTQSPLLVARDPELLWVEPASDIVFCGGRRVQAQSVFGVRSNDGAVIWSFDTGDVTTRAAIDPTDGNIVVVGNRTNSWTGASSAYANVWKLERTSGSVVWAYDIGPSVRATSVAINPETGDIAVGSATVA